VVRLTAIVPATNRPATLERCVGAIQAAETPPEEVIVVTEAPGPGPAAARNEGARRAGGDVLVFVDADVLPRPDAFARIRAAFTEDPGLVALIGSYDDAPEAPGVVSRFRNLLHHHTHQLAGGSAETFWAGLGAVRRNAFLAVGGFDQERYRVPSVEDIDLGLRLGAEGATIRLDPALQGTHLKAWTLAEMVRTDLLRRGIPWIGLLLRSGRRSQALNLGWRQRLSAAASVLVAGALLARRAGVAASALLALVALNRRFYALLSRRLGPGAAALGVALHVLHYLVSALALPLGVLAHLWERRGRRTG